MKEKRFPSFHIGAAADFVRFAGKNVPYLHRGAVPVVVTLMNRGAGISFAGAVLKFSGCKFASADVIFGD